PSRPNICPQCRSAQFGPLSRPSFKNTWRAPVSAAKHPQDHDLVPEPTDAGAGPSASTDDGVEAPADATAATDSEEVAALREKLLLAHADMQNLRRRVERDVENAHKFALEKFVGDLVPVVDNLERALATVDRANDATAAV